MRSSSLPVGTSRASALRSRRRDFCASRSEGFAIDKLAKVAPDPVFAGLNRVEDVGSRLFSEAVAIYRIVLAGLHDRAPEPLENSVPWHPQAEKAG